MADEPSPTAAHLLALLEQYDGETIKAALAAMPEDHRDPDLLDESWANLVEAAAGQGSPYFVGRKAVLEAISRAEEVKLVRLEAIMQGGGRCVIEFHRPHKIADLLLDQDPACELLGDLVDAASKNR